MKRCPLSLRLLAYALGLIALSFPVQILFLYDLKITQLSALFGKISLLNLIVITLCLINIPLLYRASRKIYFTLPLLFVAIFWNNLIVGYFAEDFSLLQTSLASLGFLALSGFVFEKKALFVLKNQNYRWWLQAERKPIQVPLSTDFFSEQSQSLKSWDLSETGMFIAVDIDHPKPGDIFDLKFKVDGLHHLKCQARIVRRSEAQGKYPKGLGVEFVDLPKQERSFLRRYLKQSDLFPRGPA